MKELELAKRHCTTIIKTTARFVHAKRADGLEIFLDRIEDGTPHADLLEWLNQVRLVGDKHDVVMAVGMVRGIQIAEHCSNRYLSDDASERNRVRATVATIRSMLMKGVIVKKVAAPKKRKKVKGV